MGGQQPIQLHRLVKAIQEEQGGVWFMYRKKKGGKGLRPAALGIYIRPGRGAPAMQLDKLPCRVPAARWQALYQAIGRYSTGSRTGVDANAEAFLGSWAIRGPSIQGSDSE